MFGFVDCVSNILKLASEPECSMYNILLIALDIVSVEVVVLPVWFVPEVMDDETIAGTQRHTTTISFSATVTFLPQLLLRPLSSNSLRSFLMSWDMKSMVFNLRKRYVMSPV